MAVEIANQQAATSRWQTVDRIFDQALDVARKERRRFVEEACSYDPGLVRLVSSLLCHSDAQFPELLSGSAEQLLEDTDHTLAAPEPADSSRSSSYRPGDRLDRYRIVREIGRGGMAAVYLAQRIDEDVFTQQVAIKVMLRPEDDGNAMGQRARLEQERQILADSQHPNLATVIDGGETPDGTPYIVLEYVDGIPIDRFSDLGRLDLAARLKLFLQVAEGVSYAHDRLIVHRDIKPSNILVTGGGNVKLLDFGIAKLLDRPLDLQVTRGGALTPAWASPEQLRGETVTTGSDVYQLGLLLYVLLTGRFPHRAGSSSQITDLLKRLTDVEPALASRVVRDERRGPVRTKPPLSASAIATSRGTTVSRLARQLTGDLDSILAKALRRDPEERYRSVSALADDIRRFLDGRAVKARGDNFTYRATRVLRRHRVAAAALGMLASVVLVAAVTSTMQARSLATERDRANQEARSAQATLELLTETLGELDPSEARGAALTAPEILHKTASSIRDRYRDQPLVKAKVLDTLAQVFISLGLYDDANALLEQAIALTLEQRGERHLDTATLQSQLGRLRLHQGRFLEAQSFIERALATKRHFLEPADTRLTVDQSNLATVNYSLTHFADAERQYREVLETLTSALGENAPRTLDVMNNLAAVISAQGRHEEALALTARLHEARAKTQGADHPTTLGAAFNLASAYGDVGRAVESLRLHQDVLERRRSVLGPEHPETLRSTQFMATGLIDTGRREEGLRLLRDVERRGTRTLGDSHPLVLSIREQLAERLLLAGELDEGVAWYRDLVSRAGKVYGKDHPVVAQVLGDLGHHLVHNAENAAARQALEQALGIWSRLDATANASQGALRARHDFALILLRLGDRERAIAVLDEAMELGHPVERIVSDQELTSLGDPLPW